MSNGTRVMLSSGTGVGPGPLASATRVTPQRCLGEVAAWNGVAMWSRFDATTQTYSLVKSVDGGAPTNVAVAPTSPT